MTVPVEPPRGPFRTRPELDLPGRVHVPLRLRLLERERKNPAAVVEAFDESVRAGGGPGARPQEHPRPRLEATSVRTRGRSRTAARTSSFGTATSPRRARLLRRGVRLLRLAPPQRGPGPDDGRGDGARQAGDRDGILRESRVHVRAEQLSRALSTSSTCPTTWWAYAPGAKWAEPDVDAAASYAPGLGASRRGARLGERRTRRDPRAVLAGTDRRLRQPIA